MAQSQLFEVAPEHLLKEDDARLLIEPIRKGLLSVWTDSVKAWNALPEDDRARLSDWPLLPAMVRFGYSQSFAKERFRNREEEGIVECYALQVFTFYVQNKILIRFNSVDRRNIVINVDGDDSREIYFRQGPFNGINSSVTRLTCGYLMDAAKANLASVIISCQVGDMPVYAFSIDTNEMQSLLLPSPVQAPEPAALDNSQLTRKKPH